MKRKFNVNDDVTILAEYGKGQKGKVVNFYREKSKLQYYVEFKNNVGVHFMSTYYAHELKGNK